MAASIVWSIVGVGQHDYVVLGTAQCLHPFAVFTPGFINVVADGRGTDEADRGDSGIVQQLVNGFLITVDDIETTLGQSCFSY